MPITIRKVIKVKLSDSVTTSSDGLDQTTNQSKQIVKRANGKTRMQIQRTSK